MMTEDSPGLDARIRIPLTLQDRCDGPGLTTRYDGYVDHCRVQAFVRVTINGQDLYFCGHHYSIYEFTFITAGYDISDQRSRINERPTDTKES
jgi:hypothetical protein